MMIYEKLQSLKLSKADILQEALKSGDDWFILILFLN